MAFAHKINRVTIYGSSFGGEEEWSTGFYMGEHDADADLPSQTLVDALGPLWQTFFTATTSYIGSAWKTAEIKIAQLGTDGKVIADTPVYYTYPTPITGGGTGPNFPPQVALVATLVGPQARGLASKGRMFLPGVMSALDGNGRIADAQRASICTNLKTFLTAVNTHAATDNVVMLASQGRKPPLLGDPVNHEVISVRVGNVYDTQRRRRNALAEAYSTATL